MPDKATSILRETPAPSTSHAPPHDDKERFHRHIRRAGLKRTAQRDLIVEVFLRTEDHLSTEDLYKLVKEQDSSIGQTTIYRTLKLLVEADLASEVRLGDGRTRYEPHNKFPQHDHMICIVCRATIEFYSAELKELQTTIAAAHGFTPTQHSLRILGRCQKCDKAFETERATEAEHEGAAEL